MKKPQEGIRIQRGGERSGGSSRLRGAPRSSAGRPTSGRAWVDAKSIVSGTARAESKAWGRRQEPRLPRPTGTNPGEEHRSRSCKLECKSHWSSPNAAGRALRWLPKALRSARGILGRAAEMLEVAVEVRLSGTISQSGSKIALEHAASDDGTPRAERGRPPALARSRAEQSVKGVETPRTQWTGVGNPGQRVRSVRWTPPAFENAEGTKNPMRGVVHIGRARRRLPRRWMSTGRTRVMR